MTHAGNLASGIHNPGSVHAGNLASGIHNPRSIHAGNLASGIHNPRSIHAGNLASAIPTTAKTRSTRTTYARAMRLPGRTDYALRAALELAASPDGPVTTDALSHRQDIPTSYLGAILAELRKAGIVRARRGPDGGWTLARPAADISLADVIRAIDGPLTNVSGTRPEDLHYSGAASGLPQVLVALRAAERQILEAVSLADVVEEHLPSRVRKLTEDPAAWH